MLQYIENIRERYGTLKGELHMIELEKGRSGLGLSLAGNKDRSKMSVFIVGIDPNGAAGKDGRLQIADELLEVSSCGKFRIYSYCIHKLGSKRFQKIYTGIIW